MQSGPTTRTTRAVECRATKPRSISKLNVTGVPGGKARSACTNIPPRLRSSVFPSREACAELIDTLQRSLTRVKRLLSRSIVPPVARIKRNSLLRSTGLKRKNSAPAWNARAMTVGSSSPVITTITEVALVADARICLASSIPSGGGMWTSRKMAWNLSVRRRAAACVLSVRLAASIPAEHRISPMSSQVSASSSTTRTRAGTLSFLGWPIDSNVTTTQWGELGIRRRHSAILQPVFQLFSKPFKIDRFREARSAPSREDPLLFGHQSVCRHGNHGNSAQLRFLAHPCEEIEAVVFTEIDVE